MAEIKVLKGGAFVDSNSIIDWFISFIHNQTLSLMLSYILFWVCVGCFKSHQGI